MLSYQHVYHAGCLADLHKHAALCILLKKMVEKDKPLTYVETHAGRGIYNLDAPEAMKTREAEQGIARLEKENWLSPDHIYRETLHAFREEFGERSYPGSPALARFHLRPEDRLYLAELHPQEVRHLQENIRGNNVHIRNTDGYSALFSVPKDQMKRGFVFVDPSYECKDEYVTLPAKIAKLKKKWPVAVLCVWYPLLPAGLHKDMVARLQAMGMSKTILNETVFYTNKKSDQSDKERGMYGSGLFIANLPYGVENDLNTLSFSLQNIKK